MAFIKVDKYGLTGQQQKQSFSSRRCCSGLSDTGSDSDLLDIIQSDEEFGDTVDGGGDEYSDYYDFFGVGGGGL